ncbi:hypothetical protein FI667_g1023, partial [Globisporangium splendens]
MEVRTMDANAAATSALNAPSVLPAQASGASGLLPGGGGSATGPPRRSDGGVSLGLFSKIAAAQKEKLAPFMNPLKGDAIGSGSVRAINGNMESNSSAVFDKRSASPSTATAPTAALTPNASSHFPDIRDTSSSHTASRASAAVRAPLNPRKVTSRNFAQNLRWTKHGFADDARPSGAAAPGIASSNVNGTATGTRTTGAYGGPGSRRSNPNVSPVVRNAPLERFQQPQQQRHSVFELKAHYLAFMWFVALMEQLLHRRSAAECRSSSSIQKPKTADLSIRSNSSLSKAQPETQSVSLSEPTTASAKTPADLIMEVNERELYFAETAEIPGVPIVYRNQKSKASNPERLNLDRWNLPVIPLLEGEQMLRLLNLQNNSIRKIENLLGLPNLIFLDLYNNRIEASGSYFNDIEVMQNLNDLKELRVLNLGGNKIAALENIEKLTLLTELNLRRNQTEHRSPGDARSSFLGMLLQTLRMAIWVTSISELRLDGNAVCDSNQSEYRCKAIRSFPVLKHLDLKPLNDTERKEAVAFYSRAKAASKERDELEEAHRAHAISCARTLWERREKVTRHSATTKTFKDLSLATSWGARSSSKQQPAAPSNPEEREIKPTSREDPTIRNNNTGFSEIEVRGEYRVLVIYGDALEVLESAKVHSLVNAITFRYIHIDRVIAAATSSTSSNLKFFGHLRRLNFAHNDIQAFDQLLWLASLGTKAEENVLRLNGEEISATGRHVGKQLFPKAGRQKTLALVSEQVAKTKEKDALVKPKHLGSCSTTSLVAGEIFAVANDIDRKAAVLEDAWRGLLTAIVRVHSHFAFPR